MTLMDIQMPLIEKIKLTFKNTGMGPSQNALSMPWAKSGEPFEVALSGGRHKFIRLISRNCPKL